MLSSFRSSTCGVYGSVRTYDMDVVHDVKCTNMQPVLFVYV